MKKDFTLIELLVVISIICILSSVIFGFIYKSRYKKEESIKKETTSYRQSDKFNHLDTGTEIPVSMVKDIQTTEYDSHVPCSDIPTGSPESRAAKKECEDSYYKSSQIDECIKRYN